MNNKNNQLLLLANATSNLGNWVYLVALNIIVWNLTKSPAAVAAIFIVVPLAKICSNLFSGSIIDRYHKKRLMILSDICRGIIIMFIPFLDSLPLIYICIFLTTAAGSLYGPSSIFLIKNIVNDQHKLRFNSLNSTFSSGAFILGPALGGVLVTLFSTSIAVWFNVFTFFLSAILVSKISFIESLTITKRQRIDLKTIYDDFSFVFGYFKQNKLLGKLIIYYITVLMIAFALDSQEMPYIKETLRATDSMYGIIVSLAGVGAIIGGVTASKLTKKYTALQYIILGLPLMIVCYIGFYSSFNVELAIIALVFLGFFMAFSNVGYDTFYQQTIPNEIVGRVTASLLLIQSIIQIVFTFVLAAVVQLVSIQFVGILFGIFALCIALLLNRILKRGHLLFTTND